MMVRVWSTRAASMRAAILLIALAALVSAALLTRSARADSGGLQYNELTRLNISGQNVAAGSYQNGSFDADFQAASAKVQQGHGMFGFIKTFQSSMNALKNGSASTYYWLNNMEREDDLTDQTATITMPDKNQIIHLDLAKKTYYIETPNTGNINQVPPQYQRPGQPPQTMPPSQPGTAKVTISVTTSSLGSQMLGGENADGYKVDFKIVSSNATGSCKNGTFESEMVEFVTRYPEQKLRWPITFKIPHFAMPQTNPEMTGQAPGCKPSIGARINHGPTAPPGRIAAWTMFNFNMSNQAQQGSMQGGIGGVTERGDFKALGSGDKSLFQVPAGFTQVSNPSS